jgi:hypothetical protein
MKAKAVVQERRVRVVVLEMPIWDAEELIAAPLDGAPQVVFRLYDAVERALADEQADRAKEREEGEDVPF